MHGLTVGAGVGKHKCNLRYIHTVKVNTCSCLKPENFVRNVEYFICHHTECFCDFTEAGQSLLFGAVMYVYSENDKNPYVFSEKSLEFL